LGVERSRGTLLRRISRVHRWLGRIETASSSLLPRLDVAGLLGRRRRRGLAGSVALVLWRLALGRIEACAALLPSVTGARLLRRRRRLRVGLTGRIALLLLLLRRVRRLRRIGLAGSVALLGRLMVSLAGSVALLLLLWRRWRLSLRIATTSCAALLPSVAGTRLLRRRRLRVGLAGRIALLLRRRSVGLAGRIALLLLLRWVGGLLAWEASPLLKVVGPVRSIA
jgi:hypothetical protein